MIGLYHFLLSFYKTVLLFCDKTKLYRLERKKTAAGRSRLRILYKPVKEYVIILFREMKGVLNMSTSMNSTLTHLLGKDLAAASNEEIYEALLKLVHEKAKPVKRR